MKLTRRGFFGAASASVAAAAILPDVLAEAGVEPVAPEGNIWRGCYVEGDINALARRMRDHGMIA